MSATSDDVPQTPPSSGVEFMPRRVTMSVIASSFNYRDKDEHRHVDPETLLFTPSPSEESFRIKSDDGYELLSNAEDTLTDLGDVFHATRSTAGMDDGKGKVVVEELVVVKERCGILANVFITCLQILIMVGFECFVTLPHTTLSMDRLHCMFAAVVVVIIGTLPLFASWSVTRYTGGISSGILQAIAKVIGTLGKPFGLILYGIGRVVGYLARRFVDGVTDSFGA